MATKNPRPIYLNLPKLGFKMSITAKVSILHRVSGVLMFLAIPFGLALFQQSLQSAEFYAECCAFASAPLMKVVYVLLMWALIHHVCAGIRFLFLDVHLGGERVTAQRTARGVMLISLILTILAGVMIC